MMDEERIGFDEAYEERFVAIHALIKSMEMGWNAATYAALIELACYCSVDLGQAKEDMVKSAGDCHDAVKGNYTSYKDVAESN